MIHDADLFLGRPGDQHQRRLARHHEDVCMRALHEAFLFPQPAAPKEPRASKFNSEEDFGTCYWHLKNDAKFRAGLKVLRKTGNG